jgi:hypothetical protein
MTAAYAWTVYTADNGTEYAVRVTKGWVDPDFGVWTDVNATGKPLLPQGKRMRRAILKRVDGVGRRWFPVQTTSAGSGWQQGRVLFLPSNAGGRHLWVVTGLCNESFQPRKYRKKRV